MAYSTSGLLIQLHERMWIGRAELGGSLCSFERYVDDCHCLRAEDIHVISALVQQLLENRQRNAEVFYGFRALLCSSEQCFPNFA